MGKVEDFNKKLRTIIEIEKPPKNNGRWLFKSKYNTDPTGQSKEMKSRTLVRLVSDSKTQICVKCKELLPQNNLVRTIFNGTKEKGWTCRPCLEKNEKTIFIDDVHTHNI